MRDILKDNKRAIVISTYIIVLFVVLINIKPIFDYVMFIVGVLYPLFLGIAIAFVLNLPMRKIEKLLKKVIKNDKFNGLIRTISILLTIILALIILYLLFLIIIPRILDSITLVFSNFNVLVSNTVKSINNILASLGIDYDIRDISFVKNIQNLSWGDLFNTRFDSILGIANGVIDNVVSFANTFMDWFLAFCLSLYLLGGKEKLLRQLKKVIYAFFKKDIAKEILVLSTRANFIFEKFVGGQLVNSAMLGIICYITYILIGIPMPELNAALICVFSIVPVFGAMAAMVVSFLLIFAFDPVKAVIFIVVFQVVTNFESNIIYPRVVGNSIGLPGIWVLLSIFILGDIFGIVGMVLAVPITALIYALFSELVNKKLKKRKINIDNEIADAS